MRPAVIVESEIGGKAYPSDGDSVVAEDIDLLIFDAAPQPLDEDVVQGSASAVHRDSDSTIDQDSRELR